MNHDNSTCSWTLVWFLQSSNRYYFGRIFVLLLIFNVFHFFNLSYLKITTCFYTQRIPPKFRMTGILLKSDAYSYNELSLWLGYSNCNWGACNIQHHIQYHINKLWVGMAHLVVTAILGCTNDSLIVLTSAGCHWCHHLVVPVSYQSHQYDMMIKKYL